MSEKQERRYKRHKRIRAKIFGTKERPRLCIFRSSKHIYAQMIDDEKGLTIVEASDIGQKPKTKLPSMEAKVEKRTKSSLTIQKPLTGKIEIAYEVGKLMAKKALEKKIEKVAFDKGGYKYHGRVKALAEGARAGGLIF